MVGTWASLLTSPSLSFLTYKVKMFPLSQGVAKPTWNMASKIYINCLALYFAIGKHPKIVYCCYYYYFDLGREKKRTRRRRGKDSKASGKSLSFLSTLTVDDLSLLRSSCWVREQCLKKNGWVFTSQPNPRFCQHLLTSRRKGVHLDSGKLQYSEKANYYSGVLNAWELARIDIWSQYFPMKCN